MPARPFLNHTPQIAGSVFIAPGAEIIGDVTLGEGSSVWYNCVLRGDTHHIRIGERTNIQDLSLVHVAAGTYPAVLGDEVTVGHRAVVHACRIGNRCLIGIGAVILDGAVIGDDCLIAAGSLVTPGMQVPSGSVVMGSPGVIKRAVRDDEKKRIKKSAWTYYELAKKYLGL